jgi:hypothetical protein
VDSGHGRASGKIVIISDELAEPFNVQLPARRGHANPPNFSTFHGDFLRCKADGVITGDKDLLAISSGCPVITAGAF